MAADRSYRAGDSIEDYCRACKTDRMHTVVAAGPDGEPFRVTCGYCRSEHNYRGGPRVEATGPAAAALPPPEPRTADYAPRTTHHAPRTANREPRTENHEPRTENREPRTENREPRTENHEPRTANREPRTVIVSDKERSAPPVTLPQDSAVDLELLLRRIIREEAGITPVQPAPKWRGGTLVLRPGTPGLQEKSWPIETFFHKVVMVRNRLRTLEQQVNASDLPDDVKVKLQGYVSGCYGSLTSFNVLFADEDDQF
jgi:hypothetical protein